MFPCRGFFYRNFSKVIFSRSCVYIVVLISRILATCFGIGKIRFAPGTCCSVVAAFVFSFNFLVFAENQDFFIVAFGVICCLFFVGIIVSRIYSEYSGEHDSKCIVIDELVGQLLSTYIILFFVVKYPYIEFVMQSVSRDLSSFVFGYIGHIILPYLKHSMLPYLKHSMLLVSIFSSFILFRVFDILKPFPINYVDKNFKSGFGIMFDDVLAGFFSGVVSCVFLVLLLNLFGYLFHHL